MGHAQAIKQVGPAAADAPLPAIVPPEDNTPIPISPAHTATVHITTAFVRPEDYTPIQNLPAQTASIHITPLYAPQRMHHIR